MAHDPLVVPPGRGKSCLDVESWERSLRLTLLRGEALRVPRGARRLRVLSGTAWVSLEGQDILLGSCETMPLAKRPGHEAVVSATGRDPLLFELDRVRGRRVLV